MKYNNRKFEPKVNYKNVVIGFMLIILSIVLMLVGGLGINYMFDDYNYIFACVLVLCIPVGMIFYSGYLLIEEAQH